MEYEEVEKSLWHAFDVLDKSAQAQNTRTSQVHKTKLKVFTNNLGQILGVPHAETIWDKVSEDRVDFARFLAVLNSNLLVGIHKLGAGDAAVKAQIDELCWMLSEKSYRARISSFGRSSSTFSKTDCFKLWKIFNFLCERGDDGKVLHPLRSDVEEAERIAAEICLSIGIPTPKPKFGERKNTGSDGSSFLLDFADFVSVVVEQVKQSEGDLAVISPGITEVYSQIVADVVRKGYMVKFGNKLTTWKERWFVLTASALRYFVSSEERDLKGTIILCPECSTQNFPEKPGAKHFRFKLITPNKQYELSASSLKAKNEWLSDFKKVFQAIGTSKESLQKQALKERKREREERRRLTAEEELARCAEREKLLEREKQLEEERQVKRFHANAQRFLTVSRSFSVYFLVCLSLFVCDCVSVSQSVCLSVCLSVSFPFSLTLFPFLSLSVSLSFCLSLSLSLFSSCRFLPSITPRILEEEFAKREELERLQAEQGQQLLKEQMSRQELESAHRAQEEALLNARAQLEALTMERLDADRNLQEAAEKLRSAEVERQRMEERMKLKEMTSSYKLAKPLSVREPNPFITHRGRGAFTQADFCRSPGPLNGAQDLDRHFNYSDQSGQSEQSDCSGSDGERSSPAAV
ncbi:hypothetical protein EGW08_008877 [Elysia chlorotica]|uniref:PH domain-containing protein n=1 Tax=Elysia chlorotica TaxID=188477 RepID=A0A3S1C5B9_ELYCH|nr:hypothetical protein EGW08_008877 [Elysia chlorotica]